MVRLRFLVVLLLLIVLVSSVILSGSTHSAGTPAPAVVVVPSQAAAHNVPAASNSTVSLPCWAVNATICVAINETHSMADNVVPNNPPGTGADYKNYPNPGDNIIFDVYSQFNLTKAWGGTSTTGEYTGTNAFLYLSVMDAQWNGIHWFCTCDGTVWHANAGQNWAPNNVTQVNKTLRMMVFPHTPGADPNATSCADQVSWYNCTISTHFLYYMEISGLGQSGTGYANNFPAGAFVQWNVTSAHYGANGNIYYNSTSNNFGYFNYFVKGAWYWSNARPIGCSPSGSTLIPVCYPNTPGSPVNPNCVLQNGNESASAFGCNLNVQVTPVGQPTVGTTVYINISTNNTWQMYSDGKLMGATLFATAYYPNGTFWMNWEAGLRPGASGWPSDNATVTLPSAFFQSTNYTLDWYIQAYDQGSDIIQSQNYTEVTSHMGLFTNSNFSQNINLTTVPSDIGNESWNGKLANGTIPALQVDQTLNVSISSINPVVPISEAIVILKVVFPQQSSAPVGGQYTMHRLQGTTTRYYLDFPSMPAGTNVSFVIVAYDQAVETVISHTYDFYIPVIASPPGGMGFFYVQVYDNSTQHFVTGANVSIVGDAGIVQIQTSTFAGLAYPNVTGQHFTPDFVPANTSYTITVTYLDFNASGEPAGTHSLQVTIFLTHIMNKTFRLLAGPNYVVEEKGDIIEFSMNVPPAPPTFAEGVSPTTMYWEALAGGLIATAMIYPIYTIWRGIRAKAEAEEKRITL
ncbi:MAG: hypothetical protein M1144_06610 [Candidatus Thermoplasmatota archaeon]|nr:hypothetical protein [Candidatus Thermoplasmatota archaeon]